jgi:hypothetical protein
MLKFFGGDDQTTTLKLQGQFNPDDPRSTTQQLFAGSFVQNAQEAGGGGGFWDQIKDALGAGGINGTEFKDQLNQFGGGWDAAFVPSKDDPDYAKKNEQAQQTMQTMMENASPEHPVFVNVDNHWVCVTGYNKDTGEISFFNPGKRQGQKEGDDNVRTMKLDDFMKQEVNAVVYQTGAVPEGTNIPDWMHDDQAAEDGGGGSRGGGVGSGGGAGGNSN